MDSKCVQVAKGGAAAIRQWRTENPGRVLHLRRADLRGVNLVGADLRRAKLSSADLRDACLVGANLTDAIATATNLAGSNLSDTNLTDAWFRDANLLASIMREARLDGASLVGARLQGAQLQGARLVRTDLGGANLDDAVLHGAVLIGTHFRGCSLARTDFTGAVCWRATFQEVDLSSARGLDAVVHRGIIGIDATTFYLSRGRIPRTFLSGSGVPADLIDYVHAISGAIQFYTCFISYTEPDDAFARVLHSDLEASGISCWRWREDAKWGGVMWDDIDNAVRLHDKVLVVCSVNSLNSPAVLSEIERCVAAETQQTRQKLFPLTVDGFVFKWQHPLAEYIRSHWVGDFRNWTDRAAYESGLCRLIAALQRPQDGSLR